MLTGSHDPLNRSLSPRSRCTFAVVLDETTDPNALAHELSLHDEEQVGLLSGHYKFSTSNWSCTSIASRLSQTDAILAWQRLEKHQKLEFRLPLEPLKHLDSSTWEVDPLLVATQRDVMTHLDISDPTFPEQWHLFNTIQQGQDMNVSRAWLEGVTGRGVTTAFIDDGVDMRSLDLAANFNADASIDFHSSRLEPPSTTHGTRCASEVAAGKNGVCGLGIAYDSQVSSIRLLGANIDESEEAAALTHQYHLNDIYSCSWGPPDTGNALGGPSKLVQRALMTGIQEGRRGKGSIYVFAAGNGGFLGDNCNFDGYTNSIYTVTIGAINRLGLHAEYSEPCSALLAVAYSSGGYQSEGADAITTTDIGVNSCTSAHGGTSAAAPLAAGAIALVLSVRPDLSWRDVQHLLYETAVSINSKDPASDWQRNQQGRNFSHLYGFGKIDAYAFVERARTWDLVKPQAWLHVPSVPTPPVLPGKKSQNVSSTVEITAPILQKANLARLEHVAVTVNIECTTRRGDIFIELHSPSGMRSYLATPRVNDNAADGFHDWTFTSVAHWGETGLGQWTLIIGNSSTGPFNGVFKDWQFHLYGEAIDAERQEKHPLVSIDTQHQDHIVDTQKLADAMQLPEPAGQSYVLSGHGITVDWEQLSEIILLVVPLVAILLYGVRWWCRARMRRVKQLV